MELTANKESQEKFNKKNADAMTLNEFIEYCEERSFINYDGFAGEILLNGNIISKDRVYPSDLLGNKGQFLKLQEELGELQMVWYNS